VQNYPNSLSNYPSSSILSLIIQDIESLENLFVRMLSPIFVSMVVTFITVIFIGSFSPELGFTLFSGIVIAGFIIPIVSAILSVDYGREILEKRDHYQRGLIQFFQFFQEAKIYQKSGIIIKSLQARQSDFSRIQAKQGFYQSFFSSISFLSVHITVIVGLLVSVNLISHNRLDPVMLAVLYLIMVSAFESVNNFSSVAQTFGVVKSASTRLSDFENLSEKSTSSNNILEGSEFNVELKNVSFKYAGSSKMALQDIDLSIRNGEKVAIVGRSGSGKTTLIDILNGFYDHYTGSIKINGQELKTLDKNCLHSAISYVSADPYLFDTTARQNLKLADNDATDNFLSDTLKKVNLDHRILSLETELGEHGSFLSGGEIQRFGIARALIMDRKCILIDEPTENLDPVIALDLVLQMLDWFSSRTLIWIMHKFYAMSSFDNIVVMDEGRIIEQGSHDELITGKGIYHDLFNGKFRE
jgi:ATP-binding cassette subfamily C protein CydC